MRRALALIAVVGAAVLVAVFLRPIVDGIEHVDFVLRREPSAAILFGGDMMFDRSIREYAAAQGGDYLFGCLDQTLENAGLVVANLEGPITGNASVSEGSAVGSGDNYTFTFPTTTAALLARHNVRMVSIGNNHMFNFKLAGVQETEARLDAAGVGHFGDPDKSEAARVARVEVAGVPLSFVNWSDWTSDNTDHTVAQVAAEKAAGRVPIVYAHWGVEYATSAPAREVALAHAFVDAGAVAVFGSHPHVVQNHEVYNGAPIYYSLGNLIFDQYWDDAVTHGLMVRLTVAHGVVTSVAEIPVVLSRDRRTCPAQP